MKLSKLIILAILVLIFAGCSDDGTKRLGFSFDLDDIDSNSNVGGRSFGVYFWDAELFDLDEENIALNNFVFVVSYDEVFKEKLFANEATLTLTVNDSIYYPREIYPGEIYENYMLDFMIERDNDEFSNFTLKYICDDFEFTDTATVTYVNDLSSITDINSWEDGTIVKLDWDLAHDNNYQLLSAGLSEEMPTSGALYCKKVKGSVRSFTFPQEYAINMDYANNYFSLTEVNQMNTKKVIGLSVKIYAYNLGYHDISKSQTRQQIARDQFRMMHGTLLRNLEIK